MYVFDGGYIVERNPGVIYSGKMIGIGPVSGPSWRLFMHFYRQVGFVIYLCMCHANYASQ